MQPELFDDLVPGRGLRRSHHPPLFPSRFLRVRVAYEDLIFSVLALILVLLAGFCLGVERGKHLVQGPRIPDVPPRMDRVARPAEVMPLNVPVQAGRQDSEPIARSRQTEGTYAIQLASYRSQAPAQAEAERLRRQGFNAQVVKQGRYFELRVSGYRQRSEAATALATLKKLYHDGFVKRI